MKTKLTFMLLIAASIYTINASADPNLACDTGGHSCALHDQNNARVGSACQCNSGGHAKHGTVANVVCATNGGHSCSTNQSVGAHCSCNSNGHQVQGTAVVQRGHGSNQSNQH